MRALTIRPPYAQLVALEHKNMETRSQSPPEDMLGRQIAIHAGRSVVESEFLWNAIREIDEPFSENAYREPLGAVIATARLANAGVIIDRADGQFMASMMEDVPVEVAPGHRVRASRFYFNRDSFGNYKVDNWVWLLTEIEPLITPVKARGQLGFWKLPQCRWDGDQMWTCCDVHRILIEGCQQCRRSPFSICEKHQAQATECATDEIVEPVHI